LLIVNAEWLQYDKGRDFFNRNFGELKNLCPVRSNLTKSDVLPEQAPPDILFSYFDGAECFILSIFFIL